MSIWANFLRYLMLCFRCIYFHNHLTTGLPFFCCHHTCHNIKWVIGPVCLKSRPMFCAWPWLDLYNKLYDKLLQVCSWCHGWNMHWAIYNQQARLTQPSPIQIWLTYAPGLFGLLPDRAWIWYDFPTFEHDNLRKFTGLTCVLPAMVRGPAISRWLIPRDWSFFSENYMIKSLYFISFINPLYSYFVLNWLKKAWNMLLWFRYKW